MLSSIGTIAGQPSLDFFRPLIIGDECARAKPDPEPYLVAMRALGVSAQSCLASPSNPPRQSVIESGGKSV